jgi:hypothetical protein
MTFILIAIAFIGGFLVGRYVGINGWATTGGLIAAAAAVAWEYLGSLFTTVQGWF